jgi:hypothetical protein
MPSRPRRARLSTLSFLGAVVALVVGAPTMEATPSLAVRRAAVLTTALAHLEGARVASDDAVAAARERRALLCSLASTDPAAVLALSMPAAVRASLPQGIRELVEQPVTVDGMLEAAMEDAPLGARVHYALHTSHGRLELFFAERGPDVHTGARVRVQGVQVGEALAARSGSTSVTVQGAALTNTTGVHRTLVLLVNFTDKLDQPYTVEAARQVVFTSTSAFDLENSYGQTSLDGDVFGWFTIPMTSTVCDQNQLATLAKNAATSAGISLSGYTHFVYGFPQNACTWWGYGQIGGSPTNAWINGSFQLRVVGHEMGHNLGLYHAHSLDCGTEPIGTTCTLSEYGDTVDIMGSSAGHFSAYQKERLGWLGTGSQPPIQTVTSSGAYWLDPMETPGGTAKALKIYQSGASGSRTYYYVELRRGVGVDAWLATNSNMMNGVVVHTGSESSANTSDELDQTPETSTFNDAALTVGRAFTDPSAGVTITPLSVSNIGATVEVDFGGSPCVATSPAISLLPVTAMWAMPGATLSYTLAVKNNDAAACPAATYVVTATVPAGWQFSPVTLSLSPGASTSRTIAVTSAAAAAEGLYSWPVTVASATDATKTASSTASAMLVRSLTVAVTLDRSSCTTNQTVTATARVTGAGSPLPGVPVAAVVTLPNGTTRALAGTTSSAGSVTLAIKVGRKDPKGVWTVRATASGGGASGTGTATFTVN